MKLKACAKAIGARIGEFTSGGEDTWWNVRNEEKAFAIAETIVALLPFALKAMGDISNYKAILRIPHGVGGSSDDPPGSCRWHIIDCGRTPPSEELPFVKVWRNSWHLRHFSDYVAPSYPRVELVEYVLKSGEIGTYMKGTPNDDSPPTQHVQKDA